MANYKVVLKNGFVINVENSDFDLLKGFKEWTSEANKMPYATYCNNQMTVLLSEVAAVFVV